MSIVIAGKEWVEERWFDSYPWWFDQDARRRMGMVCHRDEAERIAAQKQEWEER